MKKRTRSEDPRGGRVRILEWAALMAAGLVAFELAIYYPSKSNLERSSWRDKDWVVWYQAHQLYRRDPAELSKAELADVEQWCRCLQLYAKYLKRGLNSLTDDECRRIVALDKLCPSLQEHENLFPFYDACRRRLAE